MLRLHAGAGPAGNPLAKPTIDDGNKPGPMCGVSTALRDAWGRARLLEQENEVLRRAARVCRKHSCRGMTICSLVKVCRRQRIPVAVTFRGMRLARQPCCRCLAEPVTAGEIARAHWANAPFDAHRDDLKFEYRSLPYEAPRGRRIDGRAHRVAELLSQPMVERVLHAPARQERQAGDDLPRPCSETSLRITRTGCESTMSLNVRTDASELHMYAGKHVFSNQIVGYCIDSRFEQARPVVAIEALGSQPAVEGFDEPVVPGRPGRNVDYPHTISAKLLQRMGNISGPLSMRSTFGGPPRAVNTASSSAGCARRSSTRSSPRGRRRWSRTGSPTPTPPSARPRRPPVPTNIRLACAGNVRVPASLPHARAAAPSSCSPRCPHRTATRHRRGGTDGLGVLWRRTAARPAIRRRDRPGSARPAAADRSNGEAQRPTTYFVTVGSTPLDALQSRGL